MTVPAFTDQQFWKKLAHFATRAGRDVVEKALILYFAAQRPETPTWAKTIIYSALAYFILPTDAIPDVTLGFGFVDDLGTLAAALGAVAMSITPEVRAAARKKAEDWFGAEAAADTAADAIADEGVRVIPID